VNNKEEDMRNANHALLTVVLSLTRPTDADNGASRPSGPVLGVVVEWIAVSD
jgi:hypothetical protein